MNMPAFRISISVKSVTLNEVLSNYGLSKRKLFAVCKVKVIADEALNMMNILRKLSRGGLICLSPPLRDFVFQSFGALDYISKIIHNVTPLESEIIYF